MKYSLIYLNLLTVNLRFYWIIYFMKVNVFDVLHFNDSYAYTYTWAGYIERVSISVTSSVLSRSGLFLWWIHSAHQNLIQRWTRYPRVRAFGWLYIKGLSCTGLEIGWRGFREGFIRDESKGRGDIIKMGGPSWVVPSYPPWPNAARENLNLSSPPCIVSLTTKCYDWHWRWLFSQTSTV